MSLYLELIPAIAAITSGLATAYSAYKLKNKVEAEKHFINKLSESKSTINENDLKYFKNLRNKIAHNIVVNDDEISKVTEILELYVKMLKDDERKYINEAMLQESIKGRLRYADKIISKIGIEASPEYNKQSQADA